MSWISSSNTALSKPWKKTTCPIIVSLAKIWLLMAWSSWEKVKRLSSFRISQNMWRACCANEALSSCWECTESHCLSLIASHRHYREGFYEEDVGLRHSSKLIYSGRWTWDWRWSCPIILQWKQWESSQYSMRHCKVSYITFLISKI